MIAAATTIRPQRWVRRLEMAVALGGLGLLGFLLFHLSLFRFGLDQSIFAVIGDGLCEGELPYRDRFNSRTPGIYLLYAAGQLLFGKNMMAIRLLEAGALLSLFVAFGYYSRRHVGSVVPGLIGALLATLTHVQLEFWHTGQSESFGGVVLAWALLLVTWRAPSRHRQIAAWIAAGALLTFAAMLKPPLGGGFVLCLALVVRSRVRDQGVVPEARKRDLFRRALAAPGKALEPILAFAAGGGVVVAAMLLPYVLGGALPDLIWTYREVIPGYTAITGENRDLVRGVYHAVRVLLFGFSPYIFPGFALWAVLPPLGPREREGALYLFAAVVPQLFGVSLQAKFFYYHSGGMVHLMSLLSAWGLFKLWLRVRHRPLWAVLLLALLGIAHDAVLPQFWNRCSTRWQAFCDPDRRAEIEDRLYGLGSHYAADIRQTAEWLKSNTAPDDRVLVWGLQAAIYFQTDRRPASRFINIGPPRAAWVAEKALEILRRDLESPPAAIVVSHGDRPHWATGNQLDSAQALEQIPWLKDLLVTRYQRIDRFGRLEVYRLRPGSLASASASG